MRSIVALGANLGDREAVFTLADGLLGRFVGQILARSTWIETEPLNHPTNPSLVQPMYLNGVVLLETSLTPFDILRELLRIEELLGRNRGGEVRWGPRAIDLDLICCDDLVLDTPSLKLPHPEMHNRYFVLSPMNEIWSDWVHPVLGRSVQEMLAHSFHRTS